MPRFDGTGPFGSGPSTGRGMGPCGAGLKRMGGYGRGFGRSYNPYQPRVTKKEETEMLTNEAEAIEEELKAVQERLSKLRTEK